MFERFTHTTRHVMVLAQEEAREFRHASIDSAHLLLGILRLSEYMADSDSQCAAAALGRLGVTTDLVREKVGSRQPRLSDARVQMVLSDDAKSAMEEALRDALDRQKWGIEATDLLLGLIRKPDLGSTRVLEDLGVSAQAVRDELARAR